MNRERGPPSLEVLLRCSGLSMSMGSVVARPTRAATRSWIVRLASYLGVIDIRIPKSKALCRKNNSAPRGMIGQIVPMGLKERVLLFNASSLKE